MLAKWVVAAVVLAAVSPSALGSDLATWSMGTGWSTHDVASTGSFDVVLDISSAGQAVGAIRIYDNGTLIGGVSAFKSDGGVWMSLAAQPTDAPVDVRVTSARDTSGTLVLTLIGTGDFHVLTFIVGSAASASGRITSTSPGTLASAAGMGERTFFESGETQPAFAATRAHVQSSRVVVERSGTSHLAIEHGLIGIIGRTTQPAGQETVTLSGPDGTVTCPCLLSNLPGQGGAGPGLYTVVRDAVKVETQFASPLIAAIDIG